MRDYWFTTLSGVRRGEARWDAILAYEAPIRRHLAERWGRAVPAADRDDLVQEVLLAMHERLVAGFDASRGGFRPFLRTAIANRVRDWFRRRRRNADFPDRSGFENENENEYENEADEDAGAIDFEAELIAAVRAFHDARAHGPGRDRRLVYVFSGALVDGLSNQEIAAREGLSLDQVKRLLQQARAEVLEALFARRAGGGAPEAAARAADLARACLREPRKAARLLEDEGDGRVREEVSGFLDRLGRARERIADEECLRGLRAIFEA